MKFLTKLFDFPSNTITYVPQSEQEAWIGVMYASMHIDDHISETELQHMFDLLETQLLFKNKHVADYYPTVMIADRKIGSYNLIDACSVHVTENNRVLLFELVMKILLVDGKLKPKEREIAEYLTKVFNLDHELVRKIVDVVLIQNYTKLVTAN